MRSSPKPGETTQPDSGTGYLKSGMCREILQAVPQPRPRNPERRTFTYTHPGDSQSYRPVAGRRERDRALVAEPLPRGALGCSGGCGWARGGALGAAGSPPPPPPSCAPHTRRLAGNGRSQPLASLCRAADPLRTP